MYHYCQELERWKAERAESFAGMLAGLARVQYNFDEQRTKLWGDAAAEFGVPAASLPR